MNSYKWLVAGVITEKTEETSKLNYYNNLFRIGIAGQIFELSIRDSENSSSQTTFTAVLFHFRRFKIQV